MRAKVVLLAFLTGLLVIVGAALATPAFNILNPTVHARGTIEDRFAVSRAGVETLLMSFRSSTVDVVNQSLTVAPGGHTGWHSHPGPVYVTVKSGALTIVYADEATCEGTTYTAGKTFIDITRVHIGQNRGSVPAELWVTYFVPGAPGSPFRIDQQNPGNCPF